MAGWGGIFVSYRRADTAAATGRLADLLVERFGAARVFMDVDTIGPGQKFPEKIKSAIAACDVLLALIGSKWLDAVDKNGRQRLFQPDDWVALEIRAALERDITVIPILVDGAEMVGSAGLPEDLKELTTRQAISLDSESFDADAERIIGSVERVLATAELRRDYAIAQVSSSSSPDKPSDPIDQISALLIARAKRRKRLWSGTYALSMLLAYASVDFINSPTADGAIPVMLIILAGLIRCVWSLRAEIASQRLLVDQLPASAGTEPLRHALSRHHIAVLAATCLLVSLVTAISVAISPPEADRERTDPSAPASLEHRRR
jgi:hypothetical protein